MNWRAMNKKFTLEQILPNTPKGCQTGLNIFIDVALCSKEKTKWQSMNISIIKQELTIKDLNKLFRQNNLTEYDKTLLKTLCKYIYTCEVK